MYAVGLESCHYALSKYAVGASVLKKATKTRENSVAQSFD